MNHRRAFVSVLAVFILAIFVTSAIAQVGDGDEGNLGARVAFGTESIGSSFPTAATLAFGPSMYDADVTISNALVNGGSITAPIAPGESVDIKLDYSIATSSVCPQCIQQIVFGFASDSKPGECIDTGIGDASGSSSFTLTAPATPGTHYLAFGRHWQYSCTDALKGWPPIGLNSYFGAVATQLVNGGDYFIHLPIVTSGN